MGLLLHLKKDDLIMYVFYIINNISIFVWINYLHHEFFKFLSLHFIRKIIPKAKLDKCVRLPNRRCGFNFSAFIYPILRICKSNISSYKDFVKGLELKCYYRIDGSGIVDWTRLALDGNRMHFPTMVHHQYYFMLFCFKPNAYFLITKYK